MVPVRSSYRAAQAVSPDKLELTEKPLFDPPPVMSPSASRPRETAPKTEGA